MNLHAANLLDAVLGLSFLLGSLSSGMGTRGWECANLVLNHLCISIAICNWNPVHLLMVIVW